MDEQKENQRQELQTTIRNLRDVTQKLDSAKKDINDLKRDVASEQLEKDAVRVGLEMLKLV